MSSSKLFPPYRGEALGSLKRPRELLERRALLEKGEISQVDIKPTEDKAISSIIEMQREAGLKAITDGEFRRLEYFDT